MEKWTLYPHYNYFRILGIAVHDAAIQFSEHNLANE